MLYKLCLPLHLQPLHQPQHEQHTRAQTVKLQRPLNTLSEGILDSVGARTSECTRREGKRRRVQPYEQPRSLEREAGEKLVSTIVAASTACQECHLGTTSGKGCYSPKVRADGFRATCSQLRLLPGAASTKGCRTFFLRKRLCTVRNYYWSERFTARNKTEKPSDESLTDQERRPGYGADQRTVSS